MHVVSPGARVSNGVAVAVGDQEGDSAVVSDGDGVSDTVCEADGDAVGETVGNGVVDGDSVMLTKARSAGDLSKSDAPTESFKHKSSATAIPTRNIATSVQHGAWLGLERRGSIVVVRDAAEVR